MPHRPARAGPVSEATLRRSIVVVSIIVIHPAKITASVATAGIVAKVLLLSGPTIVAAHAIHIHLSAIISESIAATKSATTAEITATSESTIAGAAAEAPVIIVTTVVAVAIVEPAHPTAVSVAPAAAELVATTAIREITTAICSAIVRWHPIAAAATTTVAAIRRWYPTAHHVRRHLRRIAAAPLSDDARWRSGRPHVPIVQFTGAIGQAHCGMEIGRRLRHVQWLPIGTGHIQRHQWWNEADAATVLIEDQLYIVIDARSLGGRIAVTVGRRQRRFVGQHIVQFGHLARTNETIESTRTVGYDLGQSSAGCVKWIG